ncbi:MAG TPA: STAS/SEC14 domain-containing protein [Steroidobacteraceae bacterium]
MIQSPAMYSIRYHKPEKSVCLTWLPGTAGMTDQDFKEALEVFAEGALQHHAERLMIDMTGFRGRPGAAVRTWRDEVIVPKYNQAGVKKIAWVWPGEAGDTATGEGTQYANRYFSSEDEAQAWLAP